MKKYLSVLLVVALAVSVCILPTVTKASVQNKIYTFDSLDAGPLSKDEKVLDEITLSGSATYNIVEEEGKKLFQILKPNGQKEAIINMHIPKLTTSGRLAFKARIRAGSSEPYPSEPMYTARDFIGELRFGRALIDFIEGTVTLRDDVRLNPSAEADVSYCLPANGTWFDFTYAVDNDTKTISIAINDIPVLSQSYAGTSDNLISGSDFSGFNYICESEEQSIYIESIETFTYEKIATIADLSATSANVCIKFDAPLAYPEPKNFLVQTTDEKIGIIDCEKNGETVTLYFNKALNIGEEYAVALNNIKDIYGREPSGVYAFTPTVEATMRTASYIKSENKEILAAMSCEDNTKWFTEANILEENSSITSIWNQTLFDKNLHAAELVTSPKKEGQYSLKWDNHPYYPTLTTKRVWTTAEGANVLRFWCNSEIATAETVNIMLYSDSDKTPWRDAYYYPLKIDWSGEREIEIPLKDFYVYENPAGFNKIDELMFSTKFIKQQPHPDTVLYIDDIQFSYNSDYAISFENKYRITKKDYEDMPPFDYSILNHGYDEIKTEYADSDTQTPIQHEAYFKAERAVQGYYPAFNPGVVSFDLNGKAYIRYSSRYIQYQNQFGKWQVTDLKPVVDKYIAENWGTAEYKFVNSDTSGESVIRFDKEGIYVTLTAVRSGDYIGLLLYSRDNMKTWEIYRLPYSYAHFERIEGANTDAQNRPPIITARDQSGVYANAGILIVPQKNKDGTLDFSEQYVYSTNCLAPGHHSGDANCAITVGDKIYIAYSVLQSSSSTLPGVPTYVCEYDCKEKTMSDSVLVGYAGHMPTDDHNWPAITATSDGIVYVFLNGHNESLKYAYMQSPGNINSFTEATAIPSKVSEGSGASYASVITDGSDNIYVVTRNSYNGYRFNLTLNRKMAGQDWETEVDLVKRYKPYYEVYRNRMTYNPINQRLYVTYFAQSDRVEIYKQDYDGLIFMCPELEKTFLNQSVSVRAQTGVDEENNPVYDYLNFYGVSPDPDNASAKKLMYNKQGTEPVLLVSYNCGTSFRPAVTSDFYSGLVITDYKINKTGEKMNVEVEFYNVSNSELKPFVILAAKENESLKAISCAKEETLAQEKRKTYNFSFDYSGNGELELFIMDSSTTLRPLMCKSVLSY